MLPAQQVGDGQQILTLVGVVRAQHGEPASARPAPVGGPALVHRRRRRARGGRPAVIVCPRQRVHIAQRHPHPVHIS